MSALPHPAYVYRAMTVGDLPAAHALSLELKWPHRLEDWAMLQRVSDGVVALDGERLIGTAFACPQGDYATIGLVIVSADYQGQGIGRRLMEKALAACQWRTPILNATLAGAPLYASQGVCRIRTGGPASRPGAGTGPKQICRAAKPAECYRPTIMSHW